MGKAQGANLWERKFGALQRRRLDASPLHGGFAAALSGRGFLLGLVLGRLHAAKARRDRLGRRTRHGPHLVPDSCLAVRGAIPWKFAPVGEALRLEDEEARGGGQSRIKSRVHRPLKPAFGPATRSAASRLQTWRAGPSRHREKCLLSRYLRSSGGGLAEKQEGPRRKTRHNLKGFEP
jgi:hypothetical protein